MQDVVQIAIEPEDISTQPLYGQESEPVYTDAPHTIEIKTKGLLICKDFRGNQDHAAFK